MVEQEKEAMLNYTAKVEGWLTEKEGLYLYSLAKVCCKLGCIVEIGSWKGKSTIWLANGIRAVGGGKVYAIDPHWEGTLESFKQNIEDAGVESIVIPVLKTSMDALRDWDKPIGLLWIDGDHDYRSVRSDFLGWFPHVVKGGVIALHDTISYEGVKKCVVKQIRPMLRQNKVRLHGQIDSILAVRKEKPLFFLGQANRNLSVYVGYLRSCHSAARRATHMGKDSLRSGDYQKAREYFRLASSYQPIYWKNLRRWGLSYLPGLREFYVWRNKRRKGKKLFLGITN